jgi:hypothetical protein
MDNCSPGDPDVGTLRWQQVAIDGIVDASATYVHGVPVQGAEHDVFFVTTTCGKPLATDAIDGIVPGASRRPITPLPDHSNPRIDEPHHASHYRGCLDRHNDCLRVRQDRTPHIG